MLSQVLGPSLVENDTMLISGGRQPKDTPINNWLTHLQALYQNKFQKYLVNANLFKKVSAVYIFILLIFTDLASKIGNFSYQYLLSTANCQSIDIY